MIAPCYPESVANEVVSTELKKLVLTRSNLSVCQQCRILTQLIVIVYVMLCLNALLCLIQVNLPNSPFSLKSACFEYVPILDPILPRPTHHCFTWIDNFNPVFSVE